jgi:hypothetical protein
MTIDIEIVAAIVNLSKLRTLGRGHITLTVIMLGLLDIHQAFA